MVHTVCYLYSLLPEKSEGAIKNGQSRDTGNVGHKAKNKDIQNKNSNTENLKR
jgi:hypothetical protein